MKTVWFVVPLLLTTFGFGAYASAEIYYPWCANYGAVTRVAAPIAAFPPMSNAWPRSGAWAASVIQIRFIRLLRKNHRGTNTNNTQLKLGEETRC